LSGPLLALSALAVVLFTIGGAATAGKIVSSPIADAAQGKLHPAKLVLTGAQAPGGSLVRTMPWFSAGVLASAGQVSAQDERLEGADARDADTGLPDLGISPGTLGCSQRDADGHH